LIVNNIIVDQGKPILFEDPGNVMDYNVYISTYADKKAIKDSGVHSVAIQGEITFSEDNLLLSWKTVSILPTVPLLKNCEMDFFNSERTKDHNVPGPFQGLVNPATLKLLDGLRL
jgi:hypothetical protein